MSPAEQGGRPRGSVCRKRGITAAWGALYFGENEMRWTLGAPPAGALAAAAAGRPCGVSGSGAPRDSALTAELSARLFTRMRLLVVEDNPAVLEALSLVLAGEGHEVETARNGAEALRLIEQRAPDAILLDLWMPVMNGWEFLRRLRALPAPTRDVPVLVVTADALAARRRELPVQRLLTKPLDVDELIQALREVIGGRDGDPAAANP